MYKIDRATNSIQPLTKVSFKDLGFRERAHLQEWIANQPTVLGEELLIIQKEFAGFSDTNERLDLLALDKQGSLVVIENKLDDTGRDVTWQAIKYASYCSTLTKDNIRDIFQEYLDKSPDVQSAEECISNFFDDTDYPELVLNKGISQRIILVAANFRKEVTSTVLWLSNFRVRIQCFKATPYAMAEDLFLNVEQIIPTKDVEEFTISLAEKASDEVVAIETESRRHILRRAFWVEALAKINATPLQLFQNISPGKEAWIGAGSGIRGLAFNCVVTKDCARIELYIDRGDQVENKRIYNTLFAQKEVIEANFGEQLTWERLDNKRASRIKIQSQGNIFDKDRWPEMFDFFVKTLPRFENALRPSMKKLAL
jgi:Domain of unknown function (DUF4268)